MDYKTEYKRWLQKADSNIKDELQDMNAVQIEDAFYRDLAFGTGGLRGIIGAGTNRMNVHTVAKASQGLAEYLIHKEGISSVVIGYDSRIQSDVFAKKAAEVFSANGIIVYLYSSLLPVSAVSFGIRYLGASSGVMITASHNPSKYNGYKVYGSDGCQITTEAATEILDEIDKLDIFEDVKYMDFDVALAEGRIRYIDQSVFNAFIEAVKRQSVLFGEEINRDAIIVYSPLNGTGLVPVTKVLEEAGYRNIKIVEEQRFPDGNFPTCPYPNPEIKEAMAMGIKYAKKNNAELLIATDPDCDRVGVAVKDKKGGYQLLSGNETGILLLDYICAQRIKHDRMPENPVMIKTIVTTDMGEAIAADYGVKTINVLTGFKFIGEQIGLMEIEGKESNYIFGFEESYGYLSGSYVRDKDAVAGTYLVCEMFSYYTARNISLLDKLGELYEKYGYCLNTLHSYEFSGSAGFSKMQKIMSMFRESVGVDKKIAEFSGKKINTVLDYKNGLDSLPKSDVLKYIMEGNCSVVIRPSGTEPKLKIYISVSMPTKDKAIEIEKEIAEELKELFKMS